MVKPQRALDTDVIVVGAGTAGANVAGQLARRGLAVVVVERRAFDDGGAHWHNGVPPWMFDRAGVTRPEPPEIDGSTGRRHLIAADGTRVVTVTNPILSVDMSALGNRLRAEARDAGVRIVEHAADPVVGVRDGRCTSLTVKGSLDGAARERCTIRAGLVVDASGLRGVVRRASPALDAWCPTVRGPDLCSAGDHRFTVADRAGAEAFLARFGAEPGDGVVEVGTDGGFSTRSIQVSTDLGQASVLVGCLADGRSSTAPRMLADLRNREPWLGEPIHSGVGVIPLRRPYARFTAPGVALVGDAACQVFPGHGSGIGIGLIAGTMLAERVADASDPGDEHILWGYQADFHRTYGGLLIAFDGLRRMSTALGTSGVTELAHAGLMRPRLTVATLEQRQGTPSLGDLLPMVSGLSKHPRLAAAVVPRMVRNQVAASTAARYPASPDERRLARWDRRVAALIGA